MRAAPVPPSPLDHRFLPPPSARAHAGAGSTPGRWESAARQRGGGGWGWAPNPGPPKGVLGDHSVGTALLAPAQSPPPAEGSEDEWLEHRLLRLGLHPALTWGGHHFLERCPEEGCRAEMLRVLSPAQSQGVSARRVLWGGQYARPPSPEAAAGGERPARFAPALVPDTTGFHLPSCSSQAGETEALRMEPGLESGDLPAPLRRPSSYHAGPPAAGPDPWSLPGG